MPPWCVVVVPLLYPVHVQLCRTACTAFAACSASLVRLLSTQPQEELQAPLLGQRNPPPYWSVLGTESVPICMVAPKKNLHGCSTCVQTELGLKCVNNCGGIRAATKCGSSACLGLFDRSVAVHCLLPFFGLVGASCIKGLSRLLPASCCTLHSKRLQERAMHTLYMYAQSR
jgi:hypothetical protein